MRRQSRYWLLVIAVWLLALPGRLGTAQGPDDGLRLSSFDVRYGGRVYDATADQTTFSYLVAGTGQPPDLSHFDMQIPVCDSLLEVVGYSPSVGVSFGVDPTTGIDGIKWDVPLLVSDTRIYSVTITGNMAEGMVRVAVKDGNGFETGQVPGPACTRPSVMLEKYVSTDGGQTWLEADVAPGPAIALDGQVAFRMAIKNDGDLDLQAIQLSDPGFDLTGCAVPSTLVPGAFFECMLGPFPVMEGPHSNTAFVTADFGSGTVSATDSAHYYGGERPAVDVEKFVSVNGGAVWHDADAAPGPSAVIGHDVRFKVVVTNNGTVALNAITLSDPGFDLTSCVLPDTLAPQDSFECLVGPSAAVEGQNQNTVTVVAVAADTTVSDTDSAFYRGVTESLPVVIVIEGPVVEIRGNVIIIYGFEITLDPGDPLLIALRIGDYVRVDGGLADDSDITVIIAAVVVIVDVDIYVNAPGQGTVQVWRDGECNNPPPPWAPAHGWRAKCEYGMHPGDFNQDRK